MKRDTFHAAVAVLDSRWRRVGAVFFILYSVGALGHLFGPTREIMLAMTPWFLLTLGVVSLLPLVAGGRRYVWFWAVGTFLLTYLLEVLGVHTGLVFGGYQYGRGMGVPVFGVPPLIGFNWVLVCLGAIRLVQGWTLPWGVKVLIAAALATAFDYLMEPVAIALGYWSWAGGEIPLQNYVAWFLIALVAGFFYFVGPVRIKTRLPLLHLGAQAFFFLVLQIFAGGG
ncbi:putative membrane protein [Alkalispirochaeta americana]|uniref:Putative membrane protein n=1 Tax=Alkalispirochaeta americana TaxID=159291 RepID=A0A1N6U3S9_9SPIO|nr:carotenoid biosynthesis protein [Alkalispirochaeta americana]SIQ60220.1 putative membrane protein [Alkalispirochaeta americana]